MRIIIGNLSMKMKKEFYKKQCIKKLNNRLIKYLIIDLNLWCLALFDETKMANIANKFNFIFIIN